MNGKLYTLSLSRDKNLKIVNDNYKKLLIVRKPPLKIPKGFVHVPKLSPSLKLFHDVQLRWKNNNYTLEEEQYLKKIDIWKYKDDASFVWWSLYEQRFLKETLNMHRYFDRILELLKKGTDIYLYCFCGDYKFCHRSLIAQEFGKYICSIYNINIDNLNIDEIFKILKDQKNIEIIIN